MTFVTLVVHVPGRAVIIDGNDDVAAAVRRHPVTKSHGRVPFAVVSVAIARTTVRFRRRPSQRPHGREERRDSERRREGLHHSVLSLHVSIPRYIRDDRRRPAFRWPLTPVRTDARASAV